MKSAVWLLLIALLASPLSAATPEEFETVVDFSTTLKSLAISVRTTELENLDTDRFLILEGTVASTTIIDPTPEQFLALLELVDGEWDGVRDIDLYRVYVIVEGPDFAARLPARMPRDPGPEIIMANSELMVVGRLAGIDEGEFGERIAVVSGSYLR